MQSWCTVNAVGSLPTICNGHSFDRLAFEICCFIHRLSSSITLLWSSSVSASPTNCFCCFLSWIPSAHHNQYHFLSWNESWFRSMWSNPNKSPSWKSKYRGTELVPVYHQFTHSIKIYDPSLPPIWLPTLQSEDCHLLFHVYSTLLQCGLTSNQLPVPPITQMNTNISINQTSPKCVCARNQKEQMSARLIWKAAEK